MARLSGSVDPSHTTHAASGPDTSPYAPRPRVPVRLIRIPHLGVEPSDPYVRRYWVAALGPGAVEDLLRLVAAAHQRRKMPLPRFLHVLVQERLAAFPGDRIIVPDRVRLVPRRLVSRFPLPLRREHQLAARALAAAATSAPPPPPRRRR